MNAQETIELFGARLGDEKLEALLQRMGATKRPTLPRGEYNAYLEMREEGLALLFQDEAYREGSKKPIGSGPLVLAGAFFYAESHEGYRRFEGELPEGLTFSDARAVVHTKLGEPEWQRLKNGVVRRERWIRPEHRILVDYAQNAGSLLLVYCGIV